MFTLFKEWIVHFLHNVEKDYGISPSNRHLLILDGHKSHVSLGVIKIAMAKGLDLLTFPSHTSHALQPLDMTCFKPFKMFFRAYKDKWTLENTGKMPIKEDLAQWVSHALRKALSQENICKGFEVTSIFPLNADAVHSKLGPSSVYAQRKGKQHMEDDGHCSSIHVNYDLLEMQVQEIMEETTADMAVCTQYYVDISGDDEV